MEIVAVFDDYFFIRPSFARGAARAMDIGGSLGRDALIRSGSTAEADARALASDLRVVNRDMQAALAALMECPAREDGEE